MTWSFFWARRDRQSAKEIREGRGVLRALGTVGEIVGFERTVSVRYRRLHEEAGDIDADVACLPCRSWSMVKSNPGVPEASSASGPPAKTDQITRDANSRSVRG